MFPKKIVPVTMIRQLHFDKTLYYNEIFLCQSQLENIVKFYIQSTLLTLYHTKLVLYNLLHFRMFYGIKSEACHICREPTK